MSQRINPNILKVKPYVPGKPIEEVKREFGLKSVVKLASNESPYGPSPKVWRAIVDAARTVNRYPDGGCYELRRELAKRLKVSADQLVFGCGSDEIIVLAIRVFVQEGDEVVLARPSFLVYSIASRLAGAVLREVPLQGLKYDFAAMKREVTSRTRIVFIGNPDNPSGNYATDTELKAFLKGLPERVVVFLDEAYAEFVTAKDYPDTIALLRKRKNIVVTRTFSKFYGLAGLRIGYGITDKKTADYMNRSREPFNVTSVAQAAAVAALKDEKYYRKLLAELNRERTKLCEELEKIGVEFSRGATNFIQVKTPKDSRDVSLKLLKKGVIVRDMSVWGLRDYIRVSIGLPAENERFLKALKAVLK